MDEASTLGNLTLELQGHTLTESEADELRAFILELGARACLIQPDGVEVFGVDEMVVERIIAKLDDLLDRRTQLTELAPKERP